MPDHSASPLSSETPESPAVSAPDKDKNDFNTLDDSPSKSSVKQRADTIQLHQRVAYHLSPHVLRLKNCVCVEPLEPIPTAEAIMTVMLTRLDKVWKRTARVLSPMPRVVALTGERVFRQVREGGIELVHISGAQVPTSISGIARRELTFMFMVPSSEAENESTRHRVVAEMSVHLGRGGMREGKLENVAYRFPHDWTDWYVSRPYSLEPFPEGGVREDIIIDNKKWVTGKMILGKVYVAILGFLGGEARLSTSVFVQFMGRVGAVLRDEGRDAAAFQVEKVTAGKDADTGSSVRWIRVRMCVLDGEEYVPVADVLLDIPRPRQDGRIPPIKHLGVMYEGEWPICHQYSKGTPDPDVQELAGQARPE